MLAFCAVSAHFCLTPKKSWENSELEGVPRSSGLGMGSRELENRDNFTFHRLVFLVNFSKFPCKFHKLVPRSPQSVLNPGFPFFFRQRDGNSSWECCCALSCVHVCFREWSLWDGFCSFKILKEYPANATLWNWDLAGILMPKSFIPGF